MKTRLALAALALITAGSLVTGCGSDLGDEIAGGCPTETPEIRAVQSCTAQPGATVNVNLRTCPTCNLTGLSCDVNLNDAATTGVIFLDPVADRCEASTNCPSACNLDVIVCSFTAPSTPDTYTLQVFDPVSNQVKTGVLDVGTGPVACAF